MNNVIGKSDIFIFTVAPWKSGGIQKWHNFYYIPVFSLSYHAPLRVFPDKIVFHAVFNEKMRSDDTRV